MSCLWGIPARLEGDGKVCLAIAAQWLSGDEKNEDEDERNVREERWNGYFRYMLILFCRGSFTEICGRLVCFESRGFDSYSFFHPLASCR